MVQGGGSAARTLVGRTVVHLCLLAGVPTCACLAGAMTATWGLLVPMMLFVATKSGPSPGKPRTLMIYGGYDGAATLWLQTKWSPAV
eukprot:scaffold23051_cov140-Isochrysis_galbana.AAC.1